MANKPKIKITKELNNKVLIFIIVISFVLIFSISQYIKDMSWYNDIVSVFSFLGVAATMFAIVIAFKIKDFQQNDIKKTLLNLNLSVEKLDIKKALKRIEENIDNVESIVIVSKYSGLPGFWAGINNASDLSSILRKHFIDCNKEIRMIGPNNDAVNLYIKNVVDFLKQKRPKRLTEQQIIDKLKNVKDTNTLKQIIYNDVASFLNKRKSYGVEEQFKHRIDMWGANTRNNNLTKIIDNEYKRLHSSFECLNDNKTYIRLPKDRLSEHVNVILIRHRHPHVYGSFHDVYFFGSKDGKDTTVPEPFKPYDIYHGRIDLLAKVWQGYLEEIFKLVNDVEWVNNFFR